MKNLIVNLLLIIVIILAGAIRLTDIHAQEYELGEGNFVVMSMFSIKSLTSLQIHFRGHPIYFNLASPPLPYIILSIWMKMFGFGELATRSLAIIFNCVSILILFKLLKNTLKSKWFSLAGCLLFALNPAMIWYSRHPRMYAMFIFFSFTSFYFFYKWFKGKTDFITQFFYVMFSFFMVMTHYFGFVLLGSEGLFLLIINFKVFKKWLLRLGKIALLFLPWIFLAIIPKLKAWEDFLQQVNWLKSPTLASLPGAISYLFF